MIVLQYPLSCMYGDFRSLDFPDFLCVQANEALLF